jgi:hypothetical protein
MIYWLKTLADITSSGDFAYNSDCFPIDTNATTINLDPPERKYDVKKIIGDGASISGGDFFGSRVISFTRIYKKDGVSTSGALTADRLAFISKYVITMDDVYLVRDYNGALQYIKVRPVINDEKYKKLIMSEDFAVKLLCSIPFFKSVTETVEEFTKTTRFHSEAFTNLGVATPFTFECTFDSNDTEFKMALYENMGIKITQAFTAGDILKIESGTFRVWINNTERFNLTIVGTPFKALSGANSLRIESVSDLSDCSISYTGRYL